MKNYQVTHWGQRVSFTVLLALLMVGVSLAVLVLNAAAGARGKGPGCGGNLLDGDEENGDLILLLYGAGTWESGGPVVTKNLQIEGGWQLKAGETCSSSQVYTDTSKFEFIGPLTRSTASEFDSGPVMTIDPTVLTLTVKHMILEQQGNVLKGGGISGVISNGAYVLLENLAFANDAGSTVGTGGGLYLEVRGNSHLVISDTQFLGNSAQQTGGGFEIHIFDGSRVTFYNPEVRNNRSFNGNGGGGRIVIDRGTVSFIGGTFADNLGNQGFGGGLSVEATGSGPAYLILQNVQFSNNTASFGDSDLHTSVNLKILDKSLFLPLIRRKP
jgi:hypothetical protein